MLPDVCAAFLEHPGGVPRKQRRHLEASVVSLNVFYNSMTALSLYDTMQSPCSVHQLSSDDACLNVKVRSRVQIQMLKPACPQQSLWQLILQRRH